MDAQKVLIVIAWLLGAGVVVLFYAMVEIIDQLKAIRALLEKAR